MIAPHFGIPLIGRGVWTWIWVLLLILGILGLGGAVQWGRETHWRNLDEVLRGAGTITVALGMILFLNGFLELLGLFLIFLSLGCFVGAFIVGKRTDDGREQL
jgi:CHASE2 domain-containing sensor protein